MTNLAAPPVPNESPDLRATIVAFFELVGEPRSEALLDLWVKALAPYDDVSGALAEWLRYSLEPPKPKELIDLVLARAGRQSRAVIALRVARRHGLTVDILQSHDRCLAVSRVRQEAMWEMHRADYSYPQIGRFLNRDHTTVMHGVRRHAARMGGEARS